MDTHDLTAGSIVIAYDGSVHADRALEWGARQAEHEDRTLDLVHVIGTEETLTAVWATAGGASVAAGQQDARTTAHTMLEAAVAGVRAEHQGLEVSGHVLERGDPRDLLVEASRTAHLLVLGSRGRGPVASLLLGSVSAAVTLHAACPVVVARPPSGKGSGSGSGDGIVVGADGTVDSLPVIEFAFRQASLNALPLTVVHSYIDVVGDAEYAVAIPESETEELHVVLAQSVAGMTEKFPDVVVTSHLQRGLTHQALTSSAHSWDLIVVGRRAKTRWDRVLIGSVGRAVLEHAKTTVAVVPEMTEGSAH